MHADGRIETFFETIEAKLIVLADAGGKRTASFCAWECDLCIWAVQRFGDRPITAPRQQIP